MSDVTAILDRLRAGDGQAVADLLPLIYDELRRLAGARIAGERAGHSLDATALVHEAFLRLCGGNFESRRHFFGAASEAMRRILVERARARGAFKRGGGRKRLDFNRLDLAAEETPAEFLALHEALGRLEAEDPRKAQVVKLRFFAGLTNDQAAETLGISSSTADNDWAYAKCWLRLELERG